MDPEHLVLVTHLLLPSLCVFPFWSLPGGAEALMSDPCPVHGARHGYSWECSPCLSLAGCQDAPGNGLEEKCVTLVPSG